MSGDTGADAIARLANAVRRARAQGRAMTILTGAGCSRSAGIPLARELVTEAAALYREECERLIGPDRLDDYGAVMSCLAPNERKHLFGKYVSEARINGASLAIAALLKEGYFRRCITVNFDRVLVQACVLIGFAPKTVDLAAAPRDDTAYAAPAAIIPLFGHSFECALPPPGSETAKRIERIVRDVLWSGPALLAGYSGGSDAAFALMKREFRGDDRLYWIDVEEMPNENQAALIAVAPRTSGFIGNADADRFFVALAEELGCWPPDVLDNALELLSIEPAAEDEDLPVEEEEHLVEDAPAPAADVIDMTPFMRPSGQAPAPPDSTGSPFFASFAEDDQPAAADRAAIDRSPRPERRRIAEYWPARPDETAAEPLAPQAEALRAEAVALTERAAEHGDETLYREAVAKFAGVAALAPNDRTVLFQHANALYDLAALKQDEFAFHRAIVKYGEVLAVSPGDTEATFNLAMALYDLAAITQSEKILAEAVVKFEAVVAAAPSDHEALAGLGHALLGLANLIHDEDIYQAARSRYAEALAVEPSNVPATIGIANALSALAAIRRDESLYREALIHYRNAAGAEPNDGELALRWAHAVAGLAALLPDPQLHQEANAKFTAATRLVPGKYIDLYKWGMVLFDLADIRRDAAIYRDALAKFNAALELQPGSTEAAIGRGRALEAMAAISHDGSFYAEARDTFSSALAGENRVAEVFCHWGMTLVGQAGLNRQEDAYRDAIAKFETAVSIRSGFAEARLGWGRALLGLAKLSGDESMFRHAFAKFEEALALKPDLADALYHWGGGLIGLWRVSGDPRLLQEAHTIFDRHDALDPNRPYRRACLAAIEGDETTCRNLLYKCDRLGVLPGRQTLLEEADLESMRGRAWFAGILNRAA